MAEKSKPRWITPLIFNDQPLRPEEPSYFQFDSYARTFARIIAARHTCTPLTIGIHGEWGSGKTTLMRAMRAYLDQTTDRKKRPGFIAEGEKWPDDEQFRPVRTVWFNAWKYSREEALFVALVEEVLREMRRDGTITRLYAALSDPKQTQLRVPEAVLSTLSQVFSLGKIDLDLTRFEAESRFRANLAFLDEFLEVFDRLVGWWLYRDDAPDRCIDDRRGVLTIFIDDLDRCLPEKTVQVLEAIKLMMDRPGTVFVIGASRKVVEEAVAAHYRSFEGLRRESQRYLDKIIQVRFDLPPLQPEGEQSLADFLDGLRAGEQRLAEANPSLVESLRLLTRGGETNPRRIKTFINYAELQWALLLNSGQAERANRDHFHLWLVLTEAGGETFRAWLEQLPERERPQRIREGIAFIKRGREADEGGPPIDPQLKAMIGENRRLQGVLAQLEGFEIGPEELHLYIHLTAPPVGEVEEPTPRRVAPRLLERQPESPGEFVMDQFVRVPAGPFLMGSADDDPDAYDNEKPRHTYDIPYEYWIGRYPVTNQEFRRFVEAGGYKERRYWTEAGWAAKEKERWTEPRYWRDKGFDNPLQPVVGISWYEAVAYCRWLTERLRQPVEAAGAQRAAPLPEGWQIRLPTEAEWEKAARGEYGRKYPWGDEWDPRRCNSAEGGPGRPTPVGQYSPDGDSPYGAADMAGNVWEWCATRWVGDYGGYLEREDNGLEGAAPRAVRGGSFNLGRRFVRCAYRGGDFPDVFLRRLGFRPVAAPV